MKKEPLFFFLGFLLFSMVCIDIFWWIQISSDHLKTLEQVNKEYYEKLPGFLAKGQRVAVFNILLLSIAGFLFYQTSFLNKLKIAGKIFFILCIVLGCGRCLR